jgi:hypothetical protein
MISEVAGSSQPSGLRVRAWPVDHPATSEICAAATDFIDKDITKQIDNI